MRDLANHLAFRSAIAPQAARTDNTAIESEIIDLSGFGSACFAVNIGANTDTSATFEVTVEHGDEPDLSDATEAVDADLTGSLADAGFTAADDDNSTRKIGYVGPKQYVRLTITPSGNDAGNIFVSAIAVLSSSRYWPAV